MQRRSSRAMLGHRCRAVGDWLDQRRPSEVLALVAGLHVVLWTLMPHLVHTGLPLDVVEGYATGREWMVASHKHPNLPAWLLEGSRRLTGAVGWPAYLLSAGCIAATYALVLRLGRDLMGERLALAGTLLLTGVIYFSWTTPEFNHNVALMPTWAGLPMALWRARETRKPGWWLLIGVLGAVGLYTKLATCMLLVTATAWILLDPDCRRQLRTPWPWAGLVIFLLLVTPLAHWLVSTDFQLLDYAESRASSGKAGGFPLFALKHLAALLPPAVLLALVFGRKREGEASLPAAETGVHPLAVRFLAVFAAAPVALTTLAAVALGSGMKASWCAPMHAFTGLLAAALIGTRWRARALERLTGLALAVLVGTAVAYAAVTFVGVRTARTLPRVAWPQQEIAGRLEAVWQERMHRPLRFVAGDVWLGGMVVAFAEPRASLIVDGRLDYSLWVNRHRFEREGALVVGSGTAIFDRLTGGRVDGSISIGEGPSAPARNAISYAILTPEQAAALVAKTPDRLRRW